MTVDSSLPNIVMYLAALALLFLFARFLHPISKIPLPVTERSTPIDGLRGILALAVFFLHFATTYIYVQTGRWQPLNTRLFDLGGQMGVCLFFLITGFLFWGKIDKAKGLVDWFALYVSRGFRLTPLYWFVATLVVVTATIVSGFRFEGHIRDYLSEILTWLLFQQADINGLKDTWILIAGVNWTLIYEWAFYASLPMLAVGWILSHRSKVFRWALVSLVIFLAMQTGPILPGGLYVQYLIYFALGSLAFRLSQSEPLKRFFQKWYSGFVPLLAVLIGGLFLDNIYGFWSSFILLAIFAPIACGCTLFGLLSSRPLRFLGEISYSLYLLHGFLLYLTFSVLFPEILRTQQPFLGFWGLLCLMGVVIITASFLSYRWIEAPFVRLGRKIILAHSNH